jgi:hypothetical protein
MIFHSVFFIALLINVSNARREIRSSNIDHILADLLSEFAYFCAEKWDSGAEN